VKVKTIINLNESEIREAIIEYVRNKGYSAYKENRDWVIYPGDDHYKIEDVLLGIYRGSALIRYEDMNISSTVTLLREYKEPKEEVKAGDKWTLKNIPIGIINADNDHTEINIKDFEK